MLARDAAEPLPARAQRPARSRRLALLATLICVLAAVGASCWLLVYTAWRHELWNGFFSIVFAVLSSKAGLLWFGWRDQGLDPERKP